ncbi:hypothetical protein [Acinetobacter baumannii]|uniref:hypothetical protein n=2 Tax=Acinetobacter baumannii TaxID=470 RepID=UPI003988CA3B
MVIALLIAALFIIGLALFTKSKTKESKMPEGLQVYNEKAELILDLTDLTGKVFGYIEVPQQYANTRYSVTDSRFINAHPFIFSPDNSLADYTTWRVYDYNTEYADSSGHVRMRQNLLYIFIGELVGDTLTINVNCYSSGDTPIRIYYGAY